MVRAVQSTPLFKQCATYDELEEKRREQAPLFRLSENVDFAKLSNMVNDDDSINVDWSKIHGFLFGLVDEDD